MYVWSSHIAEYDQPGKVAKLARGQLNKENECFHVPFRTLEFGLARQDHSHYYGTGTIYY